jgi:hypothetical protein
MTRKPGEPLEHDIQGAILKYLTIKRIFHYRQNTGAAKFGKSFVKFGVKGAPDIVCVIKGQYVGLEIKAKDGEQSQAQFNFQVQLEAAGGTYLLCYSLEDVIRKLGER